MTKWLITHSSKGGVKWQIVSFNGKAGSESRGIVDLIAIRKNHTTAGGGLSKGDIFEIVLIQVKGGTAPFPSENDIARLLLVKEYHRADKAVLAEWKQGRKLCCYVLPDRKKAVPAAEIFGSLARGAGTGMKVLRGNAKREVQL